MIVLALDQATTTGWAVGETRADRHGFIRMPKRPDGERLMWLYKQLVVLADSVDQIVYEAPYFPWGRVGAKSNPDVIGWLQKVEAVVLMVAATLSCPVESKTPDWWHGGLLGYARRPKGTSDDFIKKATAEKVTALGYTFAVQDEADAIGMLTAYLNDPSRQQGDLLDLVKDQL